MNKKFLSILFTLVLVLSLSLVTAAPVAAAEDESVFTVEGGTYTTTPIDPEPYATGDISASLTGSWVNPPVLGDFVAIGTGLLYITDMYPLAGTTATIDVSGTLSATDITFSGTAVRIEGDYITPDAISSIAGTLTIQTDGTFVAALIGDTLLDPPYDTVVIDITGNIMPDTSSSADLDATYTLLPVEIGILVDPTSVSFGAVEPGVAVPGHLPVIVDNIGDVDVNLTTEISVESHPPVYADGLTIDALAVDAWTGSAAVSGDSGSLPLILTVPYGTAPDTYTATLVFWAEAVPGP
ncbi:hypothetical protein ES703_11640 [subsurface metagenome]